MPALSVIAWKHPRGWFREISETASGNSTNRLRLGIAMARWCELWSTASTAADTAPEASNHEKPGRGPRVARSS